MIPTVTEVKDFVRALLNDTQVAGGEIYTDTALQPFLASKYEEMFAEMLKEQVPAIERIATYTVTAGTTSVTPATMSVAGLGEIVSLEERTAGSSEKFYPVTETDTLSQSAQSDRLREFEWREDKFNFIGATTNREIRLTYYVSGACPGDAPPAQSLVIDGSKNFLAHATAAAAGEVKGADPDLLRHLKVMAYGGVDRSGQRVTGYLYDLISPMVREKMHVPIRPRRYRAGRSIW
jgi:hypothetical protein